MSQITTHVLDAALGSPGQDIPISLARMEGNDWTIIGQGRTNADGRLPDLCPQGQVMPAGTYRMHFDTATYFQALDQQVFYPWADVVFNIGDDGTHYHIPLLLSPYAYSTYRGS